jgi:hypothetical protein
MKKFLILAALVAGLAFLGTAQTAEASHRRGSYRSYGYGYRSYHYPSYGYYSYPSPAWRYYRHGGYYSPTRHYYGHRGHRSYHGHHRYHGHHGYRRSGFGLYIGNGGFGLSIHR